MTRVVPAVVLVFLSIAGCAAERTISGRRDFSIDPTLDHKRVALTDLVASPSSYKGTDVEFEGMFYRRDETIWNHFYTPFVADDYLSFSAWPVDARVWELSGRLTAVPTLYLRKTSEKMHDLLEVRSYDRIQIRGQVKSDYENRPWIEVHDVKILQREVFTLESLRHLVSGMTEVAEKRPAPAKDRLENAVRGTLSDEARYVAHMALGRLYEESNDFVRAMEHFSRAEGIKDEDPEAHEGYERNRRFEEARQRIEEMKEAEKP